MSLKKVFEFKIPLEKYKAGACVVRCFDQRFQLVWDESIKRRELGIIDPITFPGAVKLLAGSGGDRNIVLRAIKQSIDLHATPLVILVSHMDCGAYGTSAAFMSLEDECGYHQEELRRAADFLCDELPSLISIETYLIGLDKIFQTDAGAQSVSAMA